MKTLVYSILLILLILALAVVMVPQLRLIFFGLPEDRLSAPATPADAAPASPDRIADALRDAGLHAEPRLGDIAVSGHMARLADGTVDASTLAAYAAGIAALTEKSAAAGQPIPPAFWDAETADMLADGWTSYKVVAALNTTEGKPYLDALGAAWTRFHSFKTGGVEDTALDTALDMFAPVLALLFEVPQEHLLEQSPYLDTPSEKALYAWQQLISGATRTNPLTQMRIFDHGFARRFHLGTIWQYETGTPARDAEIWGVSGFAPRFVGPAENDNQIEHMSISMVVQGVLDEPLLILDAFEEFEQLTGGASAAEAAADEALNAAVRDLFLPGFQTDLDGAVERLRAGLKTG
ncbi:hypothetical protein [Oceanomicrobium pacificus]|uniref:Uncharacterized protein n=1 Tax=Oceanomicrobium pacificus TaxID=2692916 RepID=A0A6B0TKP7_9RHOB|nr:hypothetical protein [Oceanomicrobium pacificus]MXU65057.1 hypothetical protein [Oceanomicrobium pacificus]